MLFFTMTMNVHKNSLVNKLLMIARINIHIHIERIKSRIAQNIEKEKKNNKEVRVLSIFEFC